MFLANTKHAYDTAAADYATWIEGELATKPWDRAVLTTFATLATDPVADVGCGTGRITAYLTEQGCETFGVDVSSQLLRTASHTHPTLHFTEASMLNLPIATATLGAIVAWYSTIHIPASHLPQVLKEFERTLKPGGLVQLAFQTGTETEHRTEVGRHTVALDFHRRQPEQMAELLRSAGLEVVATLRRAPDKEGPYAEDTDQAYLLARKAAPAKTTT